MIRDQFKDAKKVTAKEERKKIAMGERNYYAKRIGKLQDLNKGLGVSMIVTTVCLAIAFAFVLLLYIVTKDAEKVEDRYELWRFLVWTILFAVSFIFTLVWHIIIKPSNAKKIEFCRHELERLNALNVSKAMAMYTLYGEDYKREQIKKHKERVEETQRLTKESQEKQSKDSDLEENGEQKKAE